ncbi:hydroxymethylbutenyl pyrophosphate reductase [endosymbiont of Acanthamoeba sp. UWC8]|uniref:4-hydroxy-3-methylbut-2-enyl diphosphate reductase n=1 Tax=endosymbiont of Acanthamoeba sp. UWC8 TaxID=86106 RepID=UPI0004D13BB3|nr:4-hydroxy-3-methylbut-2-enyl diphosphate reductase [endosymbiont of Acanthamoeba sp. UWC8]AIF81819.1 hydroxymethylbutenyl pyrophosphate reductase [endosymbiont of Acanthamoeba sp. UWC8]
MNERELKVVLARPRGFCAGVERAIDIVEKALQKYGAPVYVRHEIVHNKYVVEDLKAKGAVFVDEVDLIPPGALTIFSAHGVSEKVEEEAAKRDLPTIDATCPLVKKVHKEAQRHELEGHQIILIGHKGHPEVEGTSGRVKDEVILIQKLEDVESIKVNNPDKLAYVTQTTLSVDDTRAIIAALKKKFPNIEGPELKDICYATQNRQDAVKNLAKSVDIILVIGAKNSSNSNRLRDLGEEMGITSYLIDGAEDINVEWFSKANKIGITAGASAPEILLEKVLDKLNKLFKLKIEIMEGVEENVKFKLPKELYSV